MHYYQHHIGDFIKDTSYLTNEEVGIYMKLLWIYYDTEQPLPKDLFILSMKANARDNEKVVIGILDMFFQEFEDGWHHTRCDVEIAHYQSQIESASKAGKASAAKRAFNDRSTTVQPTKNQEPITSNHKPLTNIKTITTPEGVSESVFKDYMEVRKSKKAKWTETVCIGLEREAKKANMSLEQVLQLCCERNWVGFKSEWVKDNPMQSLEKPDKMRNFWEQVNGSTLKTIGG